MLRARRMEPDDHEDPRIALARREFPNGVRRCGTADLVARARLMPDGTIDLLWNRRTATQQRLRLGSLSGNHPRMSAAAATLAKPAPRGKFYLLTIATADESDLALLTVPRGGTTVADAPGQR